MRSVADRISAMLRLACSSMIWPYVLSRSRRLTRSNSGAPASRSKRAKARDNVGCVT